MTTTVAISFHLQLMLFLSFFSVSSYSLPESESLLKLKSSFENATQLDNWENNPMPPCDGYRAIWVGVVCFNDSVFGLQFENMGLSGKIDVDVLSEFPNLKSLSFINNHFNGTLPDFSKLKNLKSLYLSKNQFSGELPANAFEGLDKMTKLYLSENNFTGEIPSSIANIPKLQVIKFDKNGFSGQIPDLKQDTLKEVDFSNNNLKGHIPPSLSKKIPDIFSGNKGLCGAPLKACDSAAPAPAPTPTYTHTPTLTQPSSSIESLNRKQASIWIILLCFMVGAIIIFLVLIVILIIRERSQPAVQSVEAPPYASGNPNAAVDNTVRLSFLRDDRERFDLTELLKSAAEVLGSGSFGASYKTVVSTGMTVVVKRHQKMNNAMREEFQEHMKSLGRLRHKNLLPIVAYYYRKEEKLLVCDYVQNGSLAAHLHGHRSLGKPSLDWATRLNIVKGVAKGLEYLYNELPNMIAPHGHLKSSNVLLNNARQPLIMDYGLIPLINQENAQELVVAYKSPEYLKHGRITKKTDVWSLGVLILEILTGKFPAISMRKGKGSDEQDLVTWVKSVVGDNVENLSRAAEVFDKEMRGIKGNDKYVMVELLKIGLSCCENEVDKRLDLKTAVERIEELKIENHGNDDDDDDDYDYEDFQSSLSGDDHMKIDHDLA